MDPIGGTTWIGFIVGNSAAPFSSIDQAIFCCCGGCGHERDSRQAADAHGVHRPVRHGQIQARCPGPASAGPNRAPSAAHICDGGATCACFARRGRNLCGCTTSGATRSLERRPARAADLCSPRIVTRTLAADQPYSAVIRQSPRVSATPARSQYGTASRARTS